ncbi:hypothetical protein NW801_09775 [Brevibacillus laterosporus]|uniref:Uncharacterized protein n=2 Tax=Brevibacillus TaxID=55080 RepID=A0A0F7EI91_BRELA|nr:MULTISPECIES: hypothetical protein [Brevibacillus]AKF95184.1 hypothetical protein EX87_16170 [Brevibacillus laterosporus]MCR8985354.1 hypothetical protein [Brevibacillus laterosporus]MCZ0831084.1 hypothetical protein [Brevibacillus halotolerans]GIO00004.1 hypothetical protein J5TS2_06720 [Brevibacillus halotolerans]
MDKLRKGRWLKMRIKKRTLWMAVNSVYGERLLQIAQEHSRLSCDLEVNKYLSDQDKMIYTFHMKELRKEREMIIKQFDSEKEHSVLG